MAKSIHASLRKFGTQVRVASLAIVNDSANRAANDMRRDAPVDSGDLRSKVNVTPALSNSVVVASVEVKSDHVAAVEFGTPDTVALPFIQPNIRVETERMSASLPSLFRQAIS